MRRQYLVKSLCYLWRQTALAWRFKRPVSERCMDWFTAIQIAINKIGPLHLTMSNALHERSHVCPAQR